MEDEQVREMIEKEVDVEKDVDVADKPEKNGEKNRPRSATKLEKDRQNRLCRDQKKAERAKEAPEEVKPDNEVKNTWPFLVVEVGKERRKVFSW